MIEAKISMPGSLRFLHHLFLSYLRRRKLQLYFGDKTGVTVPLPMLSSLYQRNFRHHSSYNIPELRFLCREHRSLLPRHDYRNRRHLLNHIPKSASMPPYFQATMCVCQEPARRLYAENFRSYHLLIFVLYARQKRVFNIFFTAVLLICAD